MINISFLNWCVGFDTDTSRKTGHFSIVYNVLTQIGCEFQITKPSIAHVIFFSCFGDFNEVKTYPKAISILIIHEPKIIFNHSMKDILSIYNYYIGYPTDDEYSHEEGRVLLFPNWLTHYDFYNEQSDVYKYINNNVCNSEWKIHERSLLGCMIARTDFGGLRERIFKSLAKVGIRLDCPSKVCNNEPTIEKRGLTKDEYLRKYMFNVCPENNAQNNYVTEKIFHCCMNGCIPVYFGPRNFENCIESEIINLNRVVMYDATAVDDVVNTCNTIRSMCLQFDEKLVPFFQQAIFKPTATPTILKQMEHFRNFLKTIVNKIVI